MNANIPWFILFTPLVSAALILLFLRRAGRAAGAVSVFACCIAFLASVVAFLSPQPAGPNQISWLDLGPTLQLTLGVRIDALSEIMLLVVTGVGALVHIYSLVYMEHDEAKARYFGALSLFMFSMLGIVLADNFVMMFIFWELVGVSSYLLIGHWYQKASAAAAANKAFLVNRIGDFGFMAGILLLWSATGSVGFDGIHAKLPDLVKDPTFLTVATLCIFCGAVGKSAQVPLHVWLPDAMEGPTPVSALIHAATMVAAGVYMLARVFFLVEASPDAQVIITWIGIITAVLAALMATQQNDIKRILAYSTLSQLGYMVCAIGLAAPAAAMFHLFTHAFFKALLFLGAGAVIHALHHEQDIWRMGGLRKKMPVTFWTFAIGLLALAGLPGLSGFFSKDAILLAAWAKNPIVFWLALTTAVLTAYYMVRLFLVAFMGKARTHEADHAHDGPVAMTLPLIILAILAVVSGWGTEGEFHDMFHGAHVEHTIAVPVLAFGAFLLGTVGAWLLYGRAEKDPILIPTLRDKFYIDELYGALVAGTQDLLARISAWFDKWIMDGVFVRGAGGAAWGFGFVLRFFQIGNLQGYAFLFGAGLVVLMYFMLFR